MQEAIDIDLVLHPTLSLITVSYFLLSSGFHEPCLSLTQDIAFSPLFLQHLPNQDSQKRGGKETLEEAKIKGKGWV